MIFFFIFPYIVNGKSKNIYCRKKDGFISIGGTNIISELFEGYENEKKTINSKHLFYILRMPPCGDSRIKIGNSANIYNRCRAYQSHMPSERMEISN